MVGLEKSWAPKMGRGKMLVVRGKMFGPWTAKGVLRGCSFWGPEGQKKGFHLHFYSVFLLTSEKLISWWRSMKVFLIVKNQCVLDAGQILGVAGCVPKGRIPAFLRGLCCFFIKCAKACEANFHKCWSQFLWQPDPKKEPFWLEIYKVFWFLSLIHIWRCRRRG